MNASIQEAENRCLGAGAATVQNRLNFNRRISVQWKPLQDKESQQPSPFPPQHLRIGPTLSATSPSLNSTGTPSDKVVTASGIGKPDMDSWVFSFAIAPDQAKCYVNWCLAYQNGMLYWHMHLLDIYSFHNVNDISRMHHDLDNMLDWGVGP